MIDSYKKTKQTSDSKKLSLHIELLSTGKNNKKRSLEASRKPGLSALQKVFKTKSLGSKSELQKEIPQTCLLTQKRRDEHTKNIINVDQVLDDTLPKKSEPKWRLLLSKKFVLIALLGITRGYGVTFFYICYKTIGKVL